VGGGGGLVGRCGGGGGVPPGPQGPQSPPCPPPPPTDRSVPSPPEKGSVSPSYGTDPYPMKTLGSGMFRDSAAACHTELGVWKVIGRAAAEGTQRC